MASVGQIEFDEAGGDSELCSYRSGHRHQDPSRPADDQLGIGSDRGAGVRRQRQPFGDQILAGRLAPAVDVEPGAGVGAEPGKLLTAA